MSQNPGLPQNAPWVPSSQLVSPYQVIANPPGRFAARRGRLTRRGVRPRLRGGATEQAAGCPPLPPGCRQIYGWPRCTVDCGPVPKDPRLNNPTPLVWAGIGLGAAALAGGGYYLWQRMQQAELAAATGITVDGDCTKLTVTNQETAMAHLKGFIDAAVAALGETPISTLVIGASYVEGVAPTCGVSVDDAGIQGVDTWQKAAMVGGMAILISGTLHDDGRMNDAVFKQQAGDVQAFLLEHGVDDLAMIEDVFEMPEGPDASQAAGGFGGGGVIGGRQANLGGLALALLGGAAGFVLGGLVGTGVGAGAMMPKVLQRKVHYSDEGWMFEQIIIRLPWMPVDQDQYIGVVMAFPPGTELDTEGFALNRATNMVERKAFDSEAEALAWVTELPMTGGEDRQANLGGLALALLGGAAGFVLGGLVGTGVGAGAMMPKVLHRKVHYAADEWMYEQIVIHLPWMPVDQPQYIGVVMVFPPGTELDAEGFALNRATNMVERKAFDSDAEALAWVTEVPMTGGEDRQANLGGLGVAALGLGAAAAATGGYLWWRNREVAEACLGDAEWLEADGSLSETAEGQLEIAMQEALADGKQNAMDVADAAIIKVSGNPDCRLPNIIWGDLLRIRGSAIAMAVILIGGEELQPGTAEGPGAAVTGIEANATCDQLVIHDRDLSEAYFDEWMVEMGVMEGMTWVPNPVMMGAGFLQRVAPHCGVSVSEMGTPEILGVDTPQKAVMVGVFAITVSISLFDLGVITQDETNAQGAAIMEWLAQHGVDDMMAMADEVIIVAGDSGFGTHPSDTLDDWEEPLANQMVAKGSVGGDPGGMWRVYQDKVGEYQGGYYFKVWSKGDYAETGIFQTADAAEAAAIEHIISPPQQAGIQQNPLPEWCPSMKTITKGGKKWCYDPDSGGWICAEASGDCGPSGQRPGGPGRRLTPAASKPDPRSLKGCIAALEQSCTTYHAAHTKAWKKCMSAAIRGCVKTEGPFPGAGSGSGLGRVRAKGKLARRMRARNATLLFPSFEISKPTRGRRVRNAATSLLKPSRKTN